MSLSSPPREEISQLTARLRSAHEEYESASQSWSPEAEEKKRELRKARADTWVEIEAALTCLGEVERLREIERLPFEQKLARLEAFLAIPHAVAGPPAARPEVEATQEAPRAEQKLAQLDVADDDIDTAWDEEEAEPEPELRGLTPEEREVRAARAAVRREKLRAKATEKAERRKARAAIAKSKQKQKIRRPPNEPEPRGPSQSQVEEPVANESPRVRETPRAPSRRNDPRVLALLVAIVLVAGGVVLFLATRV
jgi:hypothetical protein